MSPQKDVTVILITQTKTLQLAYIDIHTHKHTDNIRIRNRLTMRRKYVRTYINKIKLHTYIIHKLIYINVKPVYMVVNVVTRFFKIT